MKIVINTEFLAEKMIAAGFTQAEILTCDSFDGWTNSLVDILEEEYDLETIIFNTIGEGECK